MTRPAVLILAYHFPPDNEVGAIRPYRFYKYLRRLGYECRVVTSFAPAGPDQDGTVEHVPDPFGRGDDGGLGRLAEVAARKFVVPGALGIRWSVRAAAAARGFIRQKSGQRVAVVSTYPPLGALLAGLQAGRGSRVRWIADFRDPLTNLAGASDARLSRLFAERLEKRVMRRADLILANTDASAEALQGRFPAHARKVHLLWNGFDPEEAVARVIAPPRRYRLISHIGDIYAGRNPAPLIASMDRLIAAGRIGADAVRWRFLGALAEPAFEAHRQLFERAQRAGWLEMQLERKSREEAQRAAAESDGLLLLQPGTAVQVPAKLFDYVRIGRPVLAYVRPGSATERLLARSGIVYRSVYPNSPPEQMDRMVAEFLGLPTDPVGASAWFEEQFDARRQTETLAGLIESLF